MLIEVFGRDAVAAGRCFARQPYVAFKNLISVTSNLDVWAIAVEGLNTMRRPRPIVMRIISIVATPRSLIRAWSHDTYLSCGHCRTLVRTKRSPCHTAI